LGLHIRDTSAADRTLVVPLGILKEAFIMNAVAASHKNNGIRGREHVLAADGTIALGNAFDTAVSGFDGYRHAGTARLAVEEILPNPFTNPADSTIVAMIYAFFTVIVP